nr:unnamed protein product [Digitaria exilis]
MVSPSRALAAGMTTCFPFDSGDASIQLKEKNLYTGLRYLSFPPADPMPDPMMPVPSDGDRRPAADAQTRQRFPHT